MVIEIPNYRAPSRNKTSYSKHWGAYHAQREEAKQLVWAAVKKRQVPFDCQVDVIIEAFFSKRIKDSSNIDSKIWVDCLKDPGISIIKDDSPKYVRYVTAGSFPSETDKLVITVKPV